MLRLMMSFSFFEKNLSVITEDLFFGKMCHSASCQNVNKPQGTETPILRQHRPFISFMSIKSFEQTQQVG